MSQFWQNLQPRLQPAVPNDRICVPGQKVVERLLLDGIDGEAGGAAVAERDQLAALVLADEAEAGLAVGEPAIARTERAEELAARFRDATSVRDTWLLKWSRLPGCASDTQAIRKH